MFNALAVTYYGLAAEINYAKNFKENAMDILMMIAFVIIGYNAVKSLAKKSWAELIAYIVVAAIILYILDGVDKLKDLGTLIMNLFS